MGWTTRSRSWACCRSSSASSVRLRRPNDPATLHFFWLTVAFFGALAFTPSGRYDRLDYFFDWADAGGAARRCRRSSCISRSCFPIGRARGRRARPAARSFRRSTCRRSSWRAAASSHSPTGCAARKRRFCCSGSRRRRTCISPLCLLGGLVLMLRALTRLRSVTARRQLRWIVWGLSVGALPFVTLYLIPFLFGRAPCRSGSTPPCCSAAFHWRSPRPSSVTG